MAFRADEAARTGYESVEAYFVSRSIDDSGRARSREALREISESLGPVVESYPSWHPLVCNYPDDRFPATHPGNGCGYKGIDHTRFFANGFITCPYGDGQEVIDSVNALPHHPVASVSAERLDVQFYHSDATPVLVKCTWDKSLLQDGTVPLSLALPLLLEKELPCWRSAEMAETWEAMQDYFLGRPHGARSSLFVNQETGLAIKKIWNSLINTGMYGPIKVRG
jgi:hypothetical protein